MPGPSTKPPTYNQHDLTLTELAEQLCIALVSFHEGELNPVYGPLIDAVVRGVGGATRLVGADLIFCPRGPLNAAALVLVGGAEGRLARLFRSITVCPSLAVFAYLHRRAADRSRSVPTRPRLNVLTWFESGPARRLIGRAVNELSGATDLWLAAESPMSTLARAGRMAAEGHWNLVLAHGQAGRDGTGVWLADGLFPGGLVQFQATFLLIS